MSRPSRLPKEELRKAIVDASKEILDREGMAGLSARAIAREVGYTAASIYNVFDSMSNILMEVNRETLGEVEVLFAASFGLGHARERLLAVVMGYVDYMRTNPARWEALFAGIRERESFPEWYVGAIDSLKERLAELIAETAPGLDHQTAGAFAENLFIAIHGLVSLDVGRRRDMLSARSTTDLAEAALDTVLTAAAGWTGRGQLAV